MDRLSTNGEMLSQVELQKLPHSSFDMANHNFLSGKLGKLIPTRIDEVYPGDTIKGHVQAVANFEPLAGPVMASMVMKQESFFVPFYDVWKNAYKFMTAKKGFNTPMPSVSPQQVFGVFRNYLPAAGQQRKQLIMSIDTAYGQLYLGYASLNNFDPDTPTAFLQDMADITDEFATSTANLKNVAEYHQVLDLVQPVIEKVRSFIYNNNTWDTYDNSPFDQLIADCIQPDIDQDTRYAYYRILCQRVLAVVQYIYEYFFGVSSLLDYVGWPVMDNWDKYFAECIRFIFREADEESESLPGEDDLFSTIPLNWLKMRAIYLCWYWNYRDQLLEADAYDPEEDDFMGDSVSDKQIFLLTLLRVRCWYKDTYTTALTNTGTGNFVVPVAEDPLSQVVNPHWSYYQFAGDGAANILLNTADYKEAYSAGATIAQISIGDIDYQVPMNYLSGALNGNTYASFDDNETSYVLSFDLFDRLRRLQSFTQKELLLGYEVDDVIYAHFMVRLSNVRMHIPQLLARGRDAVQYNTIVNNTDIPDGQPAGDKTAVAWAQGRTSEINYFAEEWGYFISFMTVLPIQSYTGGLDRSWLKLQRFDFAWPDFSTIGMDAVYNCELSAPRGAFAKAGLTDEAALAVFGYQGRYYDLKSKRDEEHGRLRTDLNYLTFSREWNQNDPPKLNYIFVHCWPRLDMFVTDDPSVDVIKQIDVYHDIDYHRAFPVPSEYLG